LVVRRALQGRLGRTWRIFPCVGAGSHASEISGLQGRLARRSYPGAILGGGDGYRVGWYLAGYPVASRCEGDTWCTVRRVLGWNARMLVGARF
jgi:hypothetical protein